MNLRGGRFGPSMLTTPIEFRKKTKKENLQPHVLIAGGAGFIGANLSREYLKRGVKITCIDNLATGRWQNVADLINHPNFDFREIDICERQPLFRFARNKKFDYVINLASPASPPKYNNLGFETLMVGSVGVKNLLDLAVRDEARFIQASTSEVYGDPQIPLQNESYWGNVNSYGPRSRYDESKRFAEALIYQYREDFELSTGIARIFNTYGPYMDPDDGRVVSNFVTQAIREEPITIYGDGSQTRSFGYIDDLVEGLISLTSSDMEGPVNLGNPNEFTVSQLADIVIQITGSKSKKVYKPLPQDDPMQRRPDIRLANSSLGWEPKVQLHEGLIKTIAYFQQEIISYSESKEDQSRKEALQPA